VYCGSCGAENPEYGRYCHRCGTVFVSGSTNAEPGSAPTAKGQSTAVSALDEDEPEVRGLRKLARIDTKPLECHSCGKTEGLIGYKFGLAKVLSAKRDWTGTAVSAVVSAVSIPLVGLGMIELPGKKTRLRALRMKLVLCEPCRRAQTSYSAHPWWHSAHVLGYTTFLSEEDLEKLKPGWLSAGSI
jgi:hypothetical protein